jgi:NTP pyrophosphatase (non-canonical NTP hydrolase)
MAKPGLIVVTHEPNFFHVKNVRSDLEKQGVKMDLDEAAKAFREFVAVIKALRTPGTGCPWDLEQTHQSLRPYLLEETYEVLDAMDRNEDRSFQEELGDLLLQVVLHAQVGEDRGDQWQPARRRCPYRKRRVLFDESGHLNL